MNEDNTNTPKDPDALLTIDEVCKILKVKKSFLYSPCRRKGPDAIPCIRLGKYLRYDLAAVKEFLVNH
ncbi:MAG: helix-turn-helix domain-containing protein [Fibrobacter sp.]|nr:helix-turn-helix domain-containing protein [Fibrobacter sp.]